MTLLLVLTLFLCFLAGAFDGIAETLKWHPGVFLFKFRSARVQFWDPALSWKNKYKNGDPLQGEKFWQSSRALVFLTDGYHLMRFLKNQALFIALALPLLITSFYLSVAVYCLSYFLYTAGFSLLYDKIFNS